MIYKDGFETDNNLRFARCPRCGNEDFSQNAQYCRICGLYAYNECEGYYDQDSCEHINHRNFGNARYCEFCGQPTMLYTEKLLKPYTEVQNTQDVLVDDNLPFDPADIPF